MRPRTLRAVVLSGFAMLAVLIGGESAAVAQRILADGIRDLSTQIAAKVTKEQKHKIAVLPFKELEGHRTVLGSYLAEELVTALLETPSFSIVERTMLDRVVSELKLDRSGLIDPETAKQVGKVAGADAIVTGTITDLASYVAVNARLIDAQSGRIFAAAEVRIVKDDDVRKIMATPAGGLADGDGAEPLNRTDGKEAPASRQALIPVSNVFIEGNNNNVRLDVTSLEFIGDKLRVNFVFANDSGSLINIAGPGVRGETFVVDSLGDQYDLIDAAGISNSGRAAPASSRVRFAVVFHAPPRGTKRLSLVLRFSGSNGWATLSFPPITLK
jgi:TolB-like protein